MTIRFTSSLTAEDENLIAPAVIQTLSSILNMLPIAYMIRIDTSDSKVYQLSGTGNGVSRAVATPAAHEHAGWRLDAQLPQS